MNIWIEHDGVSTCFDEEEYEFGETVVSKIVMLKRVMEKE